MKFGVIRFPGSNCDQDSWFTVKDILGQPVEYLWHGDQNLHGSECVIVPGGFSFGDYLRCGAIARFSPIMRSVVEFAEAGGLVLGICNGFQVLCEAGLLPGALVRNDGQKFVCKHVTLRCENNQTPFTNAISNGQSLSVPVAHGEGKYICDDATLADLQASNRILFRYVGENPNGSMDNIAGIVNAHGNVFGLMPHPERASDAALGFRRWTLDFRVAASLPAVVLTGLRSALHERLNCVMKTVDVLLYDGVDELDFCGPFEVMASCHRVVNGHWTDKPAFHVETIAEHRTTVTCAHGLCLLPDKALAQAREADIIIVPGGPAAQKEHLPLHILEFLRKASDTAELIASVSTGAFILAKAGLTDGRAITTHRARVDDLAKLYPKARVMKGHRVVADGKNLMSSAGISAGIDLALAVISRYEGQETAEFAARRIEWPGH